jgi:hypothetical protein
MITCVAHPAAPSPPLQAASKACSLYVCQSGSVTLKDQCHLSSVSSCVDLREGGYLEAEDTCFSITPEGGGGHTAFLGRGITTLTGAKSKLVRCKIQVGGGAPAPISGCLHDKGSIQTRACWCRRQHSEAHLWLAHPQKALHVASPTCDSCL